MPTPQTVAVLETNLDDQNPEGFELLMERAFAAGRAGRLLHADPDEEEPARRHW